MKKMFLGLMATVLFSGFSFGQGFEESVAIIPSENTAAKGGFAQTFVLKSFTSYKLQSTYSFNLVDFTDDGKHNDLKAGDGIYTSVYIAAKPNWTIPKKAIITEKFTQNDNLKKWIETNRPGWGLTIHCKMRYVYTGTTILGFSCSGGCIELYDCEFDFFIGGADRKK